MASIYEIKILFKGDVISLREHIFSFKGQASLIDYSECEIFYDKLANHEPIHRLGENYNKPIKPKNKKVLDIMSEIFVPVKIKQEEK